MDTKLTLALDSTVIARAKEYAKKKTGISKNLRDYKAEAIPVMTAEDYIKMKKAAPRKEGG